MEKMASMVLRYTIMRAKLKLLKLILSQDESGSSQGKLWLNQLLSSQGESLKAMTSYT